MKHTIHTPTEQFGFVETEFDDTDTSVGIVATHEGLVDTIKNEIGGTGMPEKQFNEILDLMIAREKIQMDPGELETMNKAQRYGFDLVRKSIGRIDYKNR